MLNYYLEPEANKISNYIFEVFCHKDLKQYQSVLDWVHCLLQEKKSDVLVINRDVSDAHAQIFITIILKLIKDIPKHLIKSDKKSFLEITDMSYLDLQEFEKFKLVIFNGITNDQFLSVAKDIITTNTNIMLCNPKVYVTDNLDDSLDNLNV